MAEKIPPSRRRLWTREELIQALLLYYKLPFGKMDSRTHAVIALASHLQRTPGAVALKLVNFASLDPELAGRGIGGMSNSSAIDKIVWNEFYGNWAALAEVASYTATSANINLVEDFGSSVTPPLRSTEVVAQVMLRRGQGFFRSAVLAAYDFKCCVTGISSQALLRASHIIPWSNNAALRLDPRNGLCMNALHDAAFDRGLISFSESFELQISKHLRGEIPETIYEELFQSRIGVPLAMPERFKPATEAIDFHRRTIFRP